MAYDEPADQLEAWQQGRTGFPVVDAGLRQLRATGWMHNRLRMIVASFLVKDLHLEWQHGARHFMHWLVDADLASNQHGWQWTAGCGTDAAPYFRVFNPTSQGRKFDPEGDVRPALGARARRSRRGSPTRTTPTRTPATWSATRPPSSTTPRSVARRWPGGRGSGNDASDPPLIVPRRFCGPPSSGNGGWTAGALARPCVDHDCPENRADAWPAITVALRQPPPLDTPMSVGDQVTERGLETVAGYGGADRRAGPARGRRPRPRSSRCRPRRRAPAMASYPGLVSHPFPTCVSCGTGREEGDGLRIFPGRVADQDGAIRSRPSGRRTRAWPRTATPTSTSCPAPRSPRPGRRSTASAAGPVTSPSG